MSAWLHDPMLPWILGRGLGIAAYLNLVALTLLGLWLRHPWRMQRPKVAPTAHLRTHAVLAAGTTVLIAGHVFALIVDSFAGVGLAGAFIPGRSGFKTAAVALGTIGLYLGVLVGGTAALAGRLGRRAWFPIHRLAVACFGLVWLHGVLAGSDTTALRLLYLISGAVVIAMWTSRRLAGGAVHEPARAIS
jgi:sulfoxide reductase heme-binding subunit YedZ